MKETEASATVLSRGEAVSPPGAIARPSGWTGGRIAALVIGALLALISLGPLGAGGTALWAEGSRRDAAGYVTSDVHGFTSAGSALATESIELGSPGVGWLYSQVVLGDVRIRVTPTGSGADLFVGIGPTVDVDRYLAGVGQTHISDFWSGSAQELGGDTPGSAPGTQGFWVASTSGPGPRTLSWDPANGSWTVVVMNADGSPGIDVRADLGATLPALTWIAVVSLVVGGILAVAGALLIVGAFRRRRADLARAV
ncbi:MAG TPA: hypothetical protein VFR44_05060 [Actinomycetota bacterium]|nr:hypothetical protein [Actinomycetota bacterium]